MKFITDLQLLKTGNVFIVTDDVEDTWIYIGFKPSIHYEDKNKYWHGSDDMELEFFAVRFILSDILKASLKGI